MEWWERLKRQMEDRRLTPEDVAKRAGLNVTSVYKYLTGKVAQPRGDAVKRLAHAVHMSEMALRYGGDAPNNVVPLRKVPLLDMARLGKLKPAQDPLTTWDGTSVVSVPIDVPDGSYGVTLTSESNEPDFRRGDIVICNAAEEVLPGRFVVAVLTETETAHFARFRPLAHGETKRFKLVHGNEDYPDIEVGHKIKGFILARAIKHIRDI
jgi:transcriptional regulator with XRE-family HTH domain